jgi:hypothetical protein
MSKDALPLVTRAELQDAGTFRSLAYVSCLYGMQRLVTAGKRNMATGMDMIYSSACLSTIRMNRGTLIDHGHELNNAHPFRLRFSLRSAVSVRLGHL